ncbi:MAG: disulfide reductase, partial [Deltaproteobacteria bacterium]|nr:disulfide reductase [Deltaproteobacteria bacterium]
MKYAIMRCCTTPVFLGQYETSTNAILRAFGVDYTDPGDFNCCGYPLRNIHAEAYILASARNLA